MSPESKVGIVRHALANFQTIMEEESVELSVDDIAHMAGISREEAGTIMDNFALLRRGGGFFHMERDTPVLYDHGEKRGPHELFEPGASVDDTTGVIHSSNVSGVSDDPTG